ncbi:ATP-binding protein [Arenimonas daejeonensis]|uniref:sensor histidine kinase n=1 Tax=Arenimonas daejeonensis TaxID=370777 RepID=UPI001D1535B5
MRFELRLDPELRVRAQASGLGRVLGNLLSNAVKYGPEGGVIEVEAQRGSDRAVLCVLDRGPGVPAAEQPALFRRYARLSPQPSGGEETTGLGLALARQHARAQGADLRYEDRPGGGACFRLEWPLA